GYLSTGRSNALQHSDGFSLLLDENPSYVRDADASEDQDDQTCQGRIVFCSRKGFIQVFLRVSIRSNVDEIVPEFLAKPTYHRAHLVFGHRQKNLAARAASEARESRRLKRVSLYEHARPDAKSGSAARLFVDRSTDLKRGNSNFELVSDSKLQSV